MVIVQKTKISQDLLYGDVPAEHPKEKPSIKIGEIIEENPNSRASIKTVLEKLHEQGELGSSWFWWCSIWNCYKFVQ